MLDKWLPNGDTWELERSLTHYNRITSRLQCKGQRSNNKGHIWQMLWEAIEFRKLAVKSHERPDRHIGNSLTFQNNGSLQVLWLKKLMNMGKEIKKERETTASVWFVWKSSDSKSLYKTTVKWLSRKQLMDEIQFSFNVKRPWIETGNNR